MIPIHFGQRDRLLFGLYTPAATPRKRRGALLLNPWGIEAMRAHRSIKHLSDALSRQGVDTFRFDYYGTGDSFGDGSEVALAGCLEDAEWALDELIGAASVNKVSVIGLRLGAVLAAQLAARRKRDIDKLVLWDPVASGADYLAELADAINSPTDALSEFKGFAISSQFHQELMTANYQGLPGTRAPVLLAASNDRVSVDQLQLSAKQSTSQTVPSLHCWEEEKDFGAGAVPVELLKSISQWVV